MDGDQVVGAEEEVDVVRREAVLRCLEVDAVQDQVEVAAVALDLRVMDLGERVLDRQLVEVEDVGEDAALLGRRAPRDRPRRSRRSREQPRGLDGVGALGVGRRDDEDGHRCTADGNEDREAGSTPTSRPAAHQP